MKESEQYMISSFSEACEMVKHRAVEAICAYDRPSAVYKPILMIDGNQWCASYGDMPEGVQGFGDSPSEAMHDFDCQWFKKLESK